MFLLAGTIPRCYQYDIIVIKESSDDLLLFLHEGIDGGKGRFEVELARGWLSRYERGELRVGTSIASEGIAGKPQRAYY